MEGIKVENLKFSYGDSPVLKGLSFSIAAGEFVGIMGPNGSGKTTLLRCINRNLEEISGRIILQGKDLKKYKPQEIAREIAVVPQSSTIDFNFSVREIVMMGRHPHHKLISYESENDEAVTNRCLDVTKTSELAEKSVQKLSGGELQRIIIARALAQEPRILLLDEPTAHLDISHQLEIMDLMKKLNEEEKLTVIGVYHDLNLAARYCRRLLILHKGKIIADGRLEDVLTTRNLSRVFNINAVIRRNPITANIYIDPLTPMDLENIMDKKSRSMIVNEKKGMKIHMICGAGTGSDLMRNLYEYGFELTAGVLNVLDQDHKTASELKLPIVSEASFSPISKKSHERNIKMIKESNVVIVTDVPFGTANQKNLEAVVESIKIKKQVIFYDPAGINNIKNRDFTDGTGTKIYKKLLKKALFASSLTQILNRLNQPNSTSRMYTQRKIHK